MLSERKAFKDSDNTVLISWIFVLKLGKDLEFNLSVIKIKLFVSAYFKGNFFAIIFDIYAFYYLSKCTFINNVTNNVLVTNLLTHSNSIVALSISYLLKRLSSITSYSINLFVLHELCLFKHCQFIFEFM